MTKDVISLSISVLLLFRHYISHKITFGAPSSGGVLCSACCAFILSCVCYVFVRVCLYVLWGHLLGKSGAQWLSGRVLDSRPKGRGFEPHGRHCVVSLSKTHLS